MKLQGLGGFSTAVRLCRYLVNDETVFPSKNKRLLGTRTRFRGISKYLEGCLRCNCMDIRRVRIMAKALDDDAISGQISKRYLIVTLLVH